MAYKLSIKLPEEWQQDTQVAKEEDGTEITHLEAHLPDDKNEKDLALIDICLGPMPEDTTAADEAYANYVDMIGFDEDDGPDFDPLIEWPFQKKKAYGFEALCDDESPIRVMCVEIKQKLLAVITVIGKDDETLVEAITLVDKFLRV